jgi:nucleoside-diphosphate-sugar epimerase
MQNFNDLFRNLIIEENQITVPTENEKICFVDIRDVAEVAVKALVDDNLRNNTYKLTGQQSINMHVVAHMFSEGLNKEIDYNSVTEELFKKRLIAAGWPASTIEGTMQLCSHVKSGETAIISDDIKNILGRDPIKFEQFIKDYAASWT